jgi:hypothetical protein
VPNGRGRYRLVLVPHLDAELDGQPPEAFTFYDKGFVVSVGIRRRVADIAGITTGGELAHLLKRRHRVGVPPVGQALTRLGPSCRVTAPRPAASTREGRIVMLVF